MANLMSNAAKYSRQGDNVEIVLDVHEDRARVSVSDFGLGIPDEAKRTIFDRFVQVDGAAHYRKGSSGLGLSIANSIIMRHGGQIRLDSKIGEGSTFCFEIARVKTKKLPDAIDGPSGSLDPISQLSALVAVPIGKKEPERPEVN